MKSIEILRNLFKIHMLLVSLSLIIIDICFLTGMKFPMSEMLLGKIVDLGKISTPHPHFIENLSKRI